MLLRFYSITLAIFGSIIVWSNNCKIQIPQPYSFVTQPLQSSLATDLTDVLLKIDELLPQLSDFIGQFNHIVLNNPINIITEANGNMSVDVPSTMPDIQAEKLGKKIGIIDRLITSRGQEIDSLLQKGLTIEGKIKEEDPAYTSQILSKINEFKRLNASYQH